VHTLTKCGVAEYKEVTHAMQLKLRRSSMANILPLPHIASTDLRVDDYRLKQWDNWAIIWNTSIFSPVNEILISSLLYSKTSLFVYILSSYFI